MSLRAAALGLIACALAACGGGGGHDAPAEPFGAPLATDIGAHAAVAGFGDFDRDGRVDVAVAHRGGAGDDLTVFAGNGDGTFRAAGTVAGASQAIPRDVNGDGSGDLVHCGAGNTIVVRLGNGDATWRAAATFAAGPASAACRVAAIGDVDGDGRADLVVALADPVDPSSAPLDARVLYTLRGNGDGSFTAPLRAAETDVRISDVVVADLDGDGRGDAVFNWTSADAFSGGADARLGRADVTFGPRIDVSAAVRERIGATRVTCCADFDGDGVPDAVLSERVLHLTDRFGEKRSFVLLGNGDGTLRNAGQLVDRTVAVMAWADFDRDRRVDLVAYHGESVDLAREPLLLFGNGNGTFAPSATLAIPRGSVAGADEFTRDGRVDLFLVAGTGFADDPVDALVMPNQMERRR